MLTLISMRASITFAAGQISELGRYEVHREKSFPGFGIGMSITWMNIVLQWCMYGGFSVFCLLF